MAISDRQLPQRGSVPQESIAVVPDCRDLNNKVEIVMQQLVAVTEHLTKGTPRNVARDDSTMGEVQYVGQRGLCQGNNNYYKGNSNKCVPLYQRNNNYLLYGPENTNYLGPTI